MDTIDKKLIHIVASKATGIEEIEKSGQTWLEIFINNGWVKKGDKMLDFGAGLGRFSIPFSKVSDVTAIDGNKGMVNYMKSKGVKAILSDECKIKTKFDFALCPYVLQHIHFPKAQMIVGQISKLTNRLYFTYPIIDDNCPKSYINYKQSMDVDLLESHDVSRKISLEELPVLFEKSDFNPKTIKRCFGNLFEITK